MYRLKDDGVLEESDIYNLARLREFCENVNVGNYTTPMPTDLVYSWNLAYIKLVQNNFSWKEVEDSVSYTEQA